MKVTLNVFSGRENPSWQLTEKDAKSFLERFAQKKVFAADAHQSKLGYSGFSIEANSDERLPNGIPSAFFIDGLLAEGVSEFGHGDPMLTAAESGSAAQWLISKAGKAVHDEVATIVLGDIAAKVKGKKPEKAPKPVEDKELKKLVQAAGCIIANTAYNPGFWNVQPTQQNNNCYNYAMNFKSNTFAQPGRKTGHMYTAFDCNNVGNAASFDGCKPTCNGSSKLVALVIWPGHDFHWYRRHSEGFWGHKPGSTPVRNVDNLGRLINGTTLTPANCSRGNYTIFCGYRYSPTGMQVS
jgi:hypothetical protein